MIITRKDSGYSGRGSRPLSAKCPVTKITSKPKTEIGKFSNWAWAMDLCVTLATAKSYRKTLKKGGCHARETQVGNDSRLVEAYA